MAKAEPRISLWLMGSFLLQHLQVGGCHQGNGAAGLQLCLCIAQPHHCHGVRKQEPAPRSKEVRVLRTRDESLFQCYSSEVVIAAQVCQVQEAAKLFPVWLMYLRNNSCEAARSIVRVEFGLHRILLLLAQAADGPSWEQETFWTMHVKTPT